MKWLFTVPGDALKYIALSTEANNAVKVDTTTPQVCEAVQLSAVQFLQGLSNTEVPSQLVSRGRPEARR